jgi:hypothetical protein
MANFFEQFDEPATPPGNFFAQFDRPEAKPEQQGPQLPPTTREQAFGRGVTSAASFGFRDEGSGLIAAGGGDPDNPDPAHALSSLAKGAYRLATGDTEAQQRYETEIERQRAETKRFEQQQPGASIGGQVTGAVALPIGFAARAATLPARAWAAAKTGAATGALTGLGEGEGGLTEVREGATLPDRIKGMLFGGAVGGAAGGLGAPVLEGTIAAGRYLAGKPVELIRSAIAPGAQAERAVGRAYQQAVAADPAAARRLDLAELGPGSPAVVLDVLGQPGRNLARSAANLSGQAADVIEQTLEPRAAAQSSRFTDWFRQSMNYPDAFSAQEAIEQTAKSINAPAYQRAFTEGARGIWDNELVGLSQAPALQDAIKGAIRQAQNKSAPDVAQAVGAAARWYTPDNKPTLEFWDLVKKQLDQDINVAQRAGRRADVAELSNIKTTMLNKLDTEVPAYRVARQGAAESFGAENALEAGGKFVNQNSTPQTRAAIAKMSEAERALFKDGFASRMIETIERIPDRSDVTRRIWGNPAKREQIELVLGKDRANELEAMTRAESIMQLARLATRGQSTTIQQAAGFGLAGAAGAYATGYDPSSGFVTALLPFARHKLDARVANKVAEMLMSPDPKIVDRGIKMIAGDARFMSVLRETDNALARVGGTQAGSRAP